jgi:hypothetical protein
MMTMSSDTNSEPEIPLGSPVDPEIRTDVSGASSEYRRYDCVACEDDLSGKYDDLGGTKLVRMETAIDDERGHVTDIYTYCEQCGQQRRHEPAGACPLAYHRHKAAKRRQKHDRSMATETVRPSKKSE